MNVGFSLPQPVLKFLPWNKKFVRATIHKAACSWVSYFMKQQPFSG